MALSQNGWQAHDDADGLRSLPWITGRVAPECWPIFNYLCQQFNSRVEPIRKDHSWGWAKRNIRGSATAVSNHASGTAIDLNAPAHPLGARGTFSDEQVREIRRILAELDGIVRWGGDYKNRADEMHFEVIASVGRVRQVAASLGGEPTPAPTAAPEEDDMFTDADRALLAQAVTESKAAARRANDGNAVLSRLEPAVATIARYVPVIHRWLSYLLPAAERTEKGLADVRSAVDAALAEESDDAARAKLEAIKALL